MSTTGEYGAIVGARIITPAGQIEDGTVVFDSGRITSVDSSPLPNGVRSFPAKGLTLLPGFLDVHIHGGGGADTMDATPDALRTICRTHAANGTTGLLATTITQSREKITAALACARTACEEGADFCMDGARILGIHLEGPYISPERPGAQPREFVRDYDAAEFDEWLEVSGGTMRLITLAPERPGAEELITACHRAGIVVSLGHTDVTADQTKAALSAGVKHTTHLFNAMPSIHHRKPGPIPVLLADNRACVEIIADGQHVAPEVIAMVLAAKGIDRVIFITDAMSGAGAPDGLYDLGGHSVTVANGRATLPDGTLAGSVLTMAQAARNLIRWFDRTSPDWKAIVALTSTNAARQMGWDTKGTIAPGADADMVLVDDAFNVRATFVAGRCVYHATY